MKEPGSLSFPTTDKPVAKPQGQVPGALSFDKVPEQTIKPSVNPSPTLSTVGALAMPSQSVTKPKQSVPGALFNAGPDQTEKATADHAKNRFAGLSQAQIESVQRQIQQLIPVSLSGVSSWGDKALNFQAEHTVQCAKYTREFSQLAGADLIEKVIKLTQPQTGLVSKLLHKRESPLHYKPALLTLQNSLQMMLTNCDELKSEAGKTQHRITLNMIALSAICDTLGQTPDIRIDDAIRERTMLLHQATSQITLTCAQLDQLRKQVQDLQARVTQLLFVTLPAIEMSMAQS